MTLEEKLLKSQTLVAGLNDVNFKLREQVESLQQRIRESETKARDFDLMLQAIKDNEVVKGAWDKFMMSLRMCGYDQK